MLDQFDDIAGQLYRRVAIAVLAGCLLAGAGPAHAAIFGIDVTFAPDTFVDSTSATGTLFYDNAGLTGVGNEVVTLTGFDIRYFGTFAAPQGLPTRWPTDSTGTCLALCSGRPNYIPFEITLRNGLFNGLVPGGFQRASFTPYIENGTFGFNARGPLLSIRFGTGVPGHGNATSDNLLLTAFSEPFDTTPVPLPVPALLLSSAMFIVVVRSRCDR